MPDAVTERGRREAVLETARAVIRSDAAAVAELAPQLGDQFLTVVDLLIRCEGKVLVCGMGTSGATARRMAHLLSVGGTPALYVSAADGLHGGLGSVDGKDLVIAISKGGESDELNDFVRRSVGRGATAVAMTSAPASTLAANCQHSLITTTADGYDHGGMIAMGSALASCALGDALAVVTMSARADAWNLFAQSHPGGAVGKLLRTSSPSE